MNLLCRAKLICRIRLSSLPSLQQSNSYSTSKSPKPSNPKSPKSTAPPPSFSDRINKPTGDGAIAWPKPSEIPFQSRVANFVKLIGYVDAPVQFDTHPGGEQFATTAISQEVSGKIDPTVLIPVVFEGDLAHVVASHVKQNDCVFVSGQLSSEPLPRFAKSDGFGKLHILGENLNFVEGFNRGVSRKKSEGIDQSEHDKLKEFSSETNWGSSSVSLDANIESGVKKNDGDRVMEDAKLWKFSSETNWGSNSVSVEPKIERGGSGSGDVGVKKRDGDRVMDMWRDLVKNSLLWWDYREQKAKGLVKEKYPDFKHKETGDALWFDSAPQWVLQGIGKLEFDVPVVRAKFVQGGVGGGEKKGNGGRDEDSWKDLVENPSKWWDNRVNKRNPKGPDFKHKESGKALWLRSSPEWVLSKLPPS